MSFKPLYSSSNNPAAAGSTSTAAAPTTSISATTNTTKSAAIAVGPSLPSSSRPAVVGSASPAPITPTAGSPTFTAAAPAAAGPSAYPANYNGATAAANYGYPATYGYNAGGGAVNGMGGGYGAPSVGYGYGGGGANGAAAVAGPSGYGYADAYAVSGYGYSYGYDAYQQGGQGYNTTHEELAAQQSIYTPANAVPQEEPKPKPTKGEARRTVLRKGAGEVWEDKTLMEWDPAHFRLFIGDLGNDVNEDDLVKAFGPAKGWSSFVKAKVVRDNVTNKTRGYGFVAYSDPEDFMKAWKAMDGKYVGSRPVKIKKATTQVRQVDIGAKKAKELDTKKKRPQHLSNKVRGTINPSSSWKPYIRR